MSEPSAWAWLIDKEFSLGTVIDIVDDTATVRSGDDEFRIQVSELLEEHHKLRDAGSSVSYPNKVDMIVRAINQACSNQRTTDDEPTPRWAVVKKLFCYGSTTSASICRRYGFDPDEMI
jgi:hypothetical protein